MSGMTADQQLAHTLGLSDDETRKYIDRVNQILLAQGGQPVSAALIGGVYLSLETGRRQPQDIAYAISGVMDIPETRSSEAKLFEYSQPEISKRHSLSITAKLTIACLILAVLWLFVDVGRIPTASLELPTLSARVDINKRNIDLLDTNFREVTAEIYQNLQNLSSDLNRVGALASNANNYAHTHGYSDLRLKDDISPISQTLADLVELNGVEFYWKDSQDHLVNEQFPSGPQLGFIAQEVERIFPQLVSRDSDGYLHVDYDQFPPLLVESIKEQQKQIEELQRENAALSERLDQLEEIITTLNP